MREYERRRETLYNHLVPNSIAIIASSNLQFRNHYAEWPFRQNSDFYYLTGFCEPNAIAIFCKNQAGETSFILFNQTDDPKAAIWNGKKVGQELACSDYLCDVAYPIDQISAKISEYLIDKKTIYYPFADPEVLSKINSWLKHSPETLHNLSSIIHEMRLLKSQEEIILMRQAAEISAAGHMELMQKCKPEMLEYELEAEFIYHCQKAGCRAMAYNSIVAGGNNSCTLHYNANDQILKDGDLVLVDAGGEYNYYAADITRTFPVNGHFSAAQKAIYELVLKSQYAGIAQVKPGNLFTQIQNAILQVLVEGLVELGLLTGQVDELIASKAYSKFYMHNSGHWLGLDVHDAGNYQKNGKGRILAPNMVLTVEPGLYIRENIADVDPKWRGIGVRIEDDILVTETGCEVLTNFAVKTVQDIEAQMASHKL